MSQKLITKKGINKKATKTAATKKNQSTVLVSVFRNSRQERQFAIVAYERASKDARLTW